MGWWWYKVKCARVFAPRQEVEKGGVEIPREPGSREGTVEGGVVEVWLVWFVWLMVGVLGLEWAAWSTGRE